MNFCFIWGVKKKKKRPPQTRAWIGESVSPSLCPGMRWADDVDGDENVRIPGRDSPYPHPRPPPQAPQGHDLRQKASTAQAGLSAPRPLKQQNMERHLFRIHLTQSLYYSI